VSKVDDRAQVILDYLSTHLGQRVTRPQLLAATGLSNSAGTDAAIRRARDMASAQGLHFPPAIRRRGDLMPLYLVTDQAADAILPTRRMHAIANGVRRREEVGLDFMAAHADQLDDTARGQLEMLAQARTARAAVQELEDMAMTRLAATVNGQPAA